MSDTKKLFESIQHYLNESFQKTDNTIILTDEMLKEVPLPKGNIVFDEEIQIPNFEDVYQDGRIRVVIGDNEDYWTINGYSIEQAGGYCGSSTDIGKTECSDINSLIEEVFIKGTFVDRGYSVAGLSYPGEINESEESTLLKSYKETDYGYHNNATMIYGELNDGNWYVYIPDNDAFDIYNEPITNKFIDCSYNYQTDDDKADDTWYNNFGKEHNITKNYDNDTINKIISELDYKYYGEDFID